MATFHPFQYLPFELRARIWRLTVEPRTVEVRVFYTTSHVPKITRKSTKAPRSRRVSVPHMTSSTPVSAPVQTCRETRNLGLYRQAFSELASSEPRHIWLNMDIDMVSIGTTVFGAFKPVAHLIKRLRFERRNGDDGFYYFESKEIRSFENAKEIHVLCPDGIESWHKASEEHYFPCGP